MIGPLGNGRVIIYKHASTDADVSKIVRLIRAKVNIRALRVIAPVEMEPRKYQSAGLSSKQAARIIKAVSLHPSIIDLNFAGNDQLGKTDEAMEEIASILKDKPSMVSLGLSDCGLQLKHIDLLRDALSPEQAGLLVRDGYAFSKLVIHTNGAGGESLKSLKRKAASQHVTVEEEFSYLSESSLAL